MATAQTKKKFTFPSAFTILFILLLLIALATWIIPAGSYDYNADGEPIPGTYQSVPSNPQNLLASALKGPINGMYGIEDASGNVDLWNSGVCTASRMLPAMWTSGTPASCLAPSTSRCSC
jgi:uncharacterized ion transporter superfamily protein YfcC